MRLLKNFLITGGCGFIGTNFIYYLFNNNKDFNILINADKLSYAGNVNNLKDIEKKYLNKKYFFIKTDICDYKRIKNLIIKYKIDTVINFAAESHVDRSIYGPKEFIYTNINGTFNLLEVLRELWVNKEGCLFHHISTDEVFGSLGDNGYFNENTPYNPRSPYSSSKAASDHLVRAYYHTYNLPVMISNCSNNYGPYQFPEKIIPLMILNILEEKELPVYGDGQNVRDWLYVEDHCDAVYTIITKGKLGETYNIGGENEWKNIDLVNLLCEKIAVKMNKSLNYYKRLIKFIKDRPGHDRRYAMDCNKIKSKLGWKIPYDFEKGIDKTIDWYLKNKEWIRDVKQKKYKKWYNKNYENR